MLMMWCCSCYPCAGVMTFAYRKLAGCCNRLTRSRSRWFRGLRSVITTSSKNKSATCTPFVSAPWLCLWAGKAVIPVVCFVNKSECAYFWKSFCLDNSLRKLMLAFFSVPLCKRDISNCVTVARTEFYIDLPFSEVVCVCVHCIVVCECGGKGGVCSLLVNQTESE